MLCFNTARILLFAILIKLDEEGYLAERFPPAQTRCRALECPICSYQTTLSNHVDLISRRHVVDHETVHPGLVVNLLSSIKAVSSKKPSLNMMLSLIKLLAATIRALWHSLKL